MRKVIYERLPVWFSGTLTGSFVALGEWGFDAAEKRRLRGPLEKLYRNRVTRSWLVLPTHPASTNYRYSGLQ